MFVLPADFDIPPYTIPNLDEVSFEEYVEEQEDEVLNEILGWKLWDQFKTGLEVVPTPDQKWLDLRDGVIYTDDEGVDQKWPGMKALMRPYIFSMYVRDNYAAFSGVGVNLAMAENAEVISPSTMITREYNKYSGLVGEEDCAQGGTLFGFLKTKSEDYPDWKPTTDQGTMNLWNI